MELRQAGLTTSALLMIWPTLRACKHQDQFAQCRIKCHVVNTPAQQHVFIASTAALPATAFFMQPIKMITVDNPHTVAETLQKELPGVEVKMDVGHVLFSRLNPSFDKKHPQYCKSCLPPD
jgi:hypothetical protein